MLNVSILCTDTKHPVNAWLVSWVERCRQNGLADAVVYRDAADLPGGEVLFLVSCHQIIGADTRRMYARNLVLHASDLPKGRGMSPHVWQLLEDARTITVTLLDAAEELDAGDIWHQVELVFDGTELFDEINRKLFDAEIALMDWSLVHCFSSKPQKQVGLPSYYPRRSPADSEVNPNLPLTQSFDLLRVADPDRFPAWFDLRGQRYHLRIEKAPKNDLDS